MRPDGASETRFRERTSAEDTEDEEREPPRGRKERSHPDRRGRRGQEDVSLLLQVVVETMKTMFDGLLHALKVPPSSVTDGIVQAAQDRLYDLLETEHRRTTRQATDAETDRHHDHVRAPHGRTD